MLYLVNEFIFTGYNPLSLDLAYLLALLLGSLVIIIKNPVISVLFLIGLFLSISCYLILTGLNFIGLSYLLVYVGAVSILFLFILMLINIRISELLSNSSNSITLAIMISFIFYTVIYNYILHLDYTDRGLLHKTVANSPYLFNMVHSVQEIYKDIFVYDNTSFPGFVTCQN